MNGEAANRIRPLILSSANLPAEGIPREPDWELARRLQATVVQYGDLPRRRKLEEALRLDFSLAKLGLSKADGHHVMLSTSERVGIPLLALVGQMRLRRTGRNGLPHVMIAHHPLSPMKFRLLRASGLLRGLSLLVCLTRHEQQILRQYAGLPPEKIVLVKGVACDQHFFRASPGPGEGFVFSTGVTLRDYTTLMRALGGLSVKVVVAAGSQWVKGAAVRGEIPANFTFLPRQSLSEMRDLYARCAVFAIPLRKGTQHSAGRTAAAEAMASAKPIVATDFPGMRDYVEEGGNGLLVEEQNPAALREAIMTLLKERTRATALGREGRRLAEEKWNVEVYVEHLCQLLSSAVA